jgi:pyruvate/2-oxoglutarate dehydrogenase complex dihydrolipoamide dehydrogenase (E3) component
LGSNTFHAGSYAVRGLRACANYFKGTEKAPKVGTNLDLIETSWTSWLNAQRRSSARLSAEFSEAIKRERVHSKSGRARIVGPNEISVIDPPRGINLQITSQHIILATGSRPTYSSQPEIGIMNSDHLLWQAKAARHLFVVGGGYIGCELASIYRDLGSRVTIAEAQPRLLPDWDPIAGDQCHRSSGHSSREHPGKTSPVRQKMVFSISSYRAPDASIGWTEEEATTAGLPVEALSWSGSIFSDDDFSTIEREHIAIKCLIHAESGSFLGCIAVGSHAAEVINLVSAAIATGPRVASLITFPPLARLGTYRPRCVGQG